jgi:beta-lactamase class A
VRDIMVFQRALRRISGWFRTCRLPAARMGRKSHIAVALMIATVTCAGCAQSAGQARRIRAAPAARVVPLIHTGAKMLVTAPVKSPQRLLSAAVGPLVASADGRVSVAVDDLSTGQAASFGGAEEYDTASIVKVDILSTLLYQARQEGRQLSPAEQALATTMIENSDNGAASRLYDDVGGADGIDDANQAFGLTETTVGTNGVWGLTTTTVDDQVRLLRQVFTTPSALSPDSRGYIQGLMSQVEPDQQWGVPAAADSGTPFAVKDGWLPNPTLWEINSIGEVTHDGQRMLIAVLSSGNETEDGGISLVEDVAVRAADALAQAG